MTRKTESLTKETLKTALMDVFVNHCDWCRCELCSNFVELWREAEK